MKFYAVRFAAALSTFIIGLAVASLFHPFHLFHQRTASDMAAEREILQVEREYVRAYLDHDAATLDRLLADEFTVRAYHRILSTKEERLDLLRDMSFAFESFQTSDVEAEVDGDKAKVTGMAVLQTHDGDGDIYVRGPYRYTRLLEKRDGRWQIVSVRVGR
jgi:ketosteroid isomerase-like protein